MKNKIGHIGLFWAVNISRLLLAGTFIFSGFVKAVDPMGMLYKLNAYFIHWNMAFEEDSLILKFMVVSLATVEFIIGIYLLLGIRKRLTTIVTVSLMSVMTILTTYIYAYNPVADCGCFGEAITLTNSSTLIKNIILLFASILIMLYPHYLKRLISERNQWLTSIYSWIYIIGLSLISLHYLPVIDFTPFQEGTSIKKAYYGESGENTPEELVSFEVFSQNSEEILTEEILNDTGYTFLLTMPQVNIADDGCNDRINDIYDDCQDNDYHFYALVGETADSTSINSWIDRTGAAYPILKCDAVILKAMARSNPGLILMKDGAILKKWSNNDLPVLSTEEDWNQTSNNGGMNMPFVKLILWFIIPLFTIILLDGVWIANKYYRHYIFKKTLKKRFIMRKKIVAGNWKMNMNLQEGVALAKELNTMLAADKPACDVIICTPFIHLASVANELNAEVIGLGAENCADKEKGAFTGEVSASMVKSTGAQYVILGHSERRAYYHETAEILKEKINLALANGLKVIFCIGEVLEDRESGKQNEVVKAQLEGSLFDLTQEQFSNIILAYEPVWAIGTGKTATAEQAEEMHAFIRSVIADKFGAEAAENVSILYGGSCKPSNAKEIFAKVNVDGGLIGGAALKAADFKGIIDAWKK